MKTMRKILVSTCLVLLVATFGNGQAISKVGGDEYKFIAADCLPNAQKVAIRRELLVNQEQLIKQKKLPAVQPNTVVKFDWPLRQSVNSRDPSYYGVSNFVDQNMAYPNSLLDYACGTRTYDLASGYNHGGLDIFLWPFAQHKQENSLVEIIAAASGTIIGKSDGNFDKNCSFCTTACNWNAVYVQHANGSVAWYGHMKSGSTTPKAIGQQVVQGEYLGVVGSSGNSSAPHLHFEVYADAQQTQLVDPYAGPCNSLNSESWWASPKPYYEPTINRIQTHSAAPSFGTCPGLETLNEKNVFAPANTIYFINYYHDQKALEPSLYEIFNPSGGLYQSWTHASPQYYQASYWFWFFNGLPALEGYWKYRVTYQATGQSVSHTFYVGSQQPNTSVKNGDWNSADTWSNNQVPPADARIFVQHRVTLAANKTCKSLRLGEKGEVITAPGIQLSISGP